jgi:pimeloyl-ACP methyl ester carboxylesterase
MPAICTLWDASEFAKTKLAMPVLALGGEIGMGDRLLKSMEPLAVHVEGGSIEDCGHYVMEEQGWRSGRGQHDVKGQF